MLSNTLKIISNVNIVFGGDFIKTKVFKKLIPSFVKDKLSKCKNKIGLVYKHML